MHGRTLRNVILVLLAVWHPRADAQNLISNPFFTTGTEGWTLGGAGTLPWSRL